MSEMHWPDPQRPGRPENPERDGDHWIQVDQHPPRTWWWDATYQHYTVAGRADAQTEADMVADGLRYLGPALLPSQVAAAVQAERDACAGTLTGRHWDSQFQPWEVAERGAQMIRARGPSDALADALRQAEARGMREAADVAAHDLLTEEDSAGRQYVVRHGDPDIAAAIIAAAEAKEKNDGE